MDRNRHRVTLGKIVGSICLAALGIFAQANDETDKDRLHQLFREAHDQLLEERPEVATFRGRTEFNDRWSDLSFEALDHYAQLRRRQWEALQKIDRGKLSTADQLNYDLFATNLQNRLEADRYPERLLAVDPLFVGPNVSVPLTIGIMPARAIRDYENIISRLKTTGRLVDQTIALLERGRATGITQPAIVMRDVPGQLERLSAGQPDDSPLLEAFRRFPPSVPEAEAKRLAKEASSVADAQLFPAFRRLRDYLHQTYLPSARRTIARTSLPGGADWYAFDVRRHTTTSLTPEQIHQIGLAEVKRIRSAMDMAIRQAKFVGDFAAFVQFLRTDKRFYYSNPEELLAAYRDICKRIDPELPRLFGKLPRMPYGVRPVPDHIAPSETTARYFPGSADGSRAGYFVANTYKLETRPKYEMEALSLHEAVPGHHLQIALALEMQDVPEFRKGNRLTVFTEGWGLYAESLGDELGFYRNPYSKFGQLSYEMWRACRLVVDTGMHALGWSRQRAIDFMKANTALTEQNIIVEVDRYIASPGQALAYKLGELKIKELRREAERELGSRFDVRDFHDVVLRNGPLTLDLLTREVRDYIAERKSN